MNHDEATRTNAAAGYFLNDLGEADKEAFEAHMFDCTICADEVRVIGELWESLRGHPDTDSRFHTVHAAAAYVLGDLTGANRESFEAHMLQCRTCWNGVNLGVKIVSNLNRALKGEIAAGTGRVAALNFCKWFQLVFGE